jgi:RNA polymerase-binding transcription factor DksA
MDDIDCAAERVEAFNAVALKTVLARMEGPVSNGICRACDSEIEQDRLRANPNAKHCRECADEIEAETRRKNRCGPR